MFIVEEFVFFLIEIQTLTSERGLSRLAPIFPCKRSHKIGYTHAFIRQRHYTSEALHIRGGHMKVKSNVKAGATDFTLDASSVCSVKASPTHPQTLTIA
jgi:hypothetical protein